MMAFGVCEAKKVAAEKITQIRPPSPRDGRPDGGGFRGKEEPTLAEMLQDPTMGSLMASDGVQQDRLLELIQAVRTRLIY
ncbi:hypothetical protein [Telmatospirillum siberiense]|uniref:Uncharacterized protein n=1 Tax=Telmatospirillum siberiense TaxID=382514 RepID=A0A2N3PVG0_9PROT|nr:hypothetical protein [Telmatospirillum siberiense]PKU24377.1 hypothetical protein CWS72_12365 [Telmatospirillum siberiense]